MQWQVRKFSLKYEFSINFINVVAELQKNISAKVSDLKLDKY